MSKVLSTQNRRFPFIAPSLSQFQPSHILAVPAENCARLGPYGPFQCNLFLPTNPSSPYPQPAKVRDGNFSLLSWSVGQLPKRSLVNLGPRAPSSDIITARTADGSGLLGTGLLARSRATLPCCTCWPPLFWRCWVGFDRLPRLRPPEPIVCRVVLLFWRPFARLVASGFPPFLWAL